MCTPRIIDSTPRRLAGLLALVATFLVLMSVTAATASAAIYMKLGGIDGTGSSIPAGTCLDCLPPALQGSVNMTCTVCIAGLPTAGHFALDLGVITYPPSPCKVKSVDGTLSVGWDNGSTSTATVSGRFRQNDTVLALLGAFSPTDPVFPSGAVKLLLDNFPPNPCLAATSSITGTAEIRLQ